MNPFYIIAGMLVFFLCAAHAFWGETRIFKGLGGATFDQETQISLYIPWHQITYVLFASGVALLLSAALPELRYVPYMIAAVIIGNFAVFVAILILKKQTQMFALTLPQTILFLALIALIILGIFNPAV